MYLMSVICQAISGSWDPSSKQNRDNVSALVELACGRISLSQRASNTITTYVTLYDINKVSVMISAKRKQGRARGHKGWWELLFGTGHREGCSSMWKEQQVQRSWGGSGLEIFWEQ